MLGIKTTRNPVENGIIRATGLSLLRAFARVDMLDSRTLMSMGINGMAKMADLRVLLVPQVRNEGMVALTLTYTESVGGQTRKQRYITYGDWFIEGNFLITYDEDGRKRAHALPKNTRYISEEKSNASR